MSRGYLVLLGGGIGPGPGCRGMGGIGGVGYPGPGYPPGMGGGVPMGMVPMGVMPTVPPGVLGGFWCPHTETYTPTRQGTVISFTNVQKKPSLL